MQPLVARNGSKFWGSCFVNAPNLKIAIGVTWAKQALAPHWHHFIEQAWHARQGVRFGIKIGQRAEHALLKKTLEFMTYVVARSEHLTDTMRDVSPGQSE